MYRFQPTRILRLSRPSFSPRFLSTTPTRPAQKDAQDKDSLKPRSTEYSKSGSDDAAAHSNAAFDPNQTRPETEEHTAEKEGGGNSLNASPGNPDISQPNDPKVGGSGNAPPKNPSGGGSAPKNG